MAQDSAWVAVSKFMRNPGMVGSVVPASAYGPAHARPARLAAHRRSGRIWPGHGAFRRYATGAARRSSARAADAGERSARSTKNVVPRPDAKSARRSASSGAFRLRSNRNSVPLPGDRADHQHGPRAPRWLEPVAIVIGMVFEPCASPRRRGQFALEILAHSHRRTVIIAQQSILHENSIPPTGLKSPGKWVLPAFGSAAEHST